MEEDANHATIPENQEELEAPAPIQTHNRSRTLSSMGTTTIDLAAVNPLESEAETMILKAIEKDTAPANNASLLGSVPAESMDVFSPPQVGPDIETGSAVSPGHNVTGSTHTLASANSNQSQPPKHRRGNSNALHDTLADLTDALAGLHGEGIAGPPVEPIPNAPGDSAGETLAHNADLIFRKLVPAKGRLNLMDSDNPPGSGELPIQIPPTVQEDPVGEDMDSEHPSGRPVNGHTNVPPVEAQTTTKGHRRYLQRLSRNAHPWVLRDFRIFVDQRRNSFLTRVRFMLLAFLPAWGAALILFYLAGA